MPIATNPQTGETVFLNERGEWTKAMSAVHPQTNKMVVYDGKDWVDAPVPSRSLGTVAGDIGRSLAQGATFGFADEISAGADAALGSGTYAENLAREQKRTAEIPAGLRIPGEVVGGLATGAAGAPLAMASGLARVPGLIRNPAVGAITGGLYGAGEAEPGHRMEGAGKGATIGLATGVATPPILNTAAAVGRGVRHAVSPQANVAADLGRAIKRDATTPDAVMQAAQGLQRIRPGTATLADAGGENVRGLVERVAQTPGAGRTQVIPALTQRQQGQMGRIATDLRTLTGTQKTAVQAIQETMDQRKQSAKPLYDQAFNFNATQVPEIVRAWQQETSTGFGRSFLLRPEFRRTLQTEYGIQNPADAPLMVQIDAWKKVADDFVTDNIGTNKARIVTDMRKRVLDVVDQHNPNYAKARDAWAGPSRYLDAINEGRNVLSTKISAEELTAALGAMSQAEQEAFRIGAVSAVVGKMGADPAKMADMTKYLRSPEMKAKITAIMPTPEARQKWSQILDFEIKSSEMTGRALGNSATARRLAEREDADSIAGDLVMDAFSGAPPVSLLRRMIGAVPKKVRDTLRSRSDAVLGELLTDPQSMAGLRAALSRVNATQGPPSILRNPAAITGTNAGIVD